MEMHIESWHYLLVNFDLNKQLALNTHT